MEASKNGRFSRVSPDELSETVGGFPDEAFSGEAESGDDESAAAELDEARTKRHEDIVAEDEAKKIGHIPVVNQTVSGDSFDLNPPPINPQPSTLKFYEDQKDLKGSPNIPGDN